LIPIARARPRSFASTSGAIAPKADAARTRGRTYPRTAGPRHRQNRAWIVKDRMEKVVSSGAAQPLVAPEGLSLLGVILWAAHVV
jgi:hypothetical protein